MHHQADIHRTARTRSSRSQFPVRQLVGEANKTSQYPGKMHLQHAYRSADDTLVPAKMRNGSLVQANCQARARHPDGKENSLHRRPVSGRTKRLRVMGLHAPRNAPFQAKTRNGASNKGSSNKANGQARHAASVTARILEGRGNKLHQGLNTQPCHVRARKDALTSTPQARARGKQQSISGPKTPSRYPTLAWTLSPHRRAKRQVRAHTHMHTHTHTHTHTHSHTPIPAPAHEHVDCPDANLRPSCTRPYHSSDQ